VAHKVETAALVVSLRDFIREVLDRAPMPAALSAPLQGPLRLTGNAGRGGRGEREAGSRRRAGGGGGGGGGGPAWGGAGAGAAIEIAGDG
jgi:hypothetical protein